MTETITPVTRRALREAERGTRLPEAPSPPLQTSAPDTKPKIGKHFGAIDGARGVAILSVLLYHSGWSERGLFGVDMFFVISGFLITLLLVREAQKNGRIHIGRFYGRRARRLIPPLIATLLVTLVAVWKYGTLSELTAAGHTAVAALLQVANWHQIAGNNAYWEAAGDIVPLGQMWSLSATEQFYVVWPLLVAVLWIAARRRPSIMTILLTMTFVASALVAPLQFDGENVDRLYLGTDTRAVSFVAGAMTAAMVVWLQGRGSRWVRPGASPLTRIVTTTVSVASLSVVVVASVATTSYHAPWLYTGGIAGVSLAIAVFIATLCSPANALSRFFTWAPFRNIGVLAYSIFLLHLPVFWFLTRPTGIELHPLAVFVIGGFITWFLALILHHVIAEPLRVRAWRPVGTVVAIVTAFTLVLVSAWLLPLERVVNPRTSPPIAAADATGPFHIADRVTLPSGDPTKVVVIGDSVAGNFVEALSEFSAGRITPIDDTYGGCGIFDADSARTADGWVMKTKQFCWPWKDKLRAANAEQPDVYILHNLWDANDQLIDGEWVGPGSREWEARYEQQLELLHTIGAEAGHEPTILLSNDRSRDPSGSLSPERLAAKNAVAERMVAKYPNMHILDLESAVCPGGTCLTEDSEGRPIYRDGAHFSVTGMEILAPWLENEVAQVLPKSS